MSLTLAIISIILSALIGIGLGYYLRFLISLGKKGSVELEIKQMLIEAKERAVKITEDAQREADELFANVKDEIKTKQEKNTSLEARLLKKEDTLEQRQRDLDQRHNKIVQDSEALNHSKEEINSIRKELQLSLEKAARMNQEEALAKLLETVSKNAEADLLHRMQKLEAESEERLESKAKSILTTSIQRLATSVAPDVFTTVVEIPSEEVKGRIIGKEGRNIKAFERATGVELVIDDTPGTITISSFDPVRRQIARVALEELINDGRIQPAKIESAVAEAEQNINKIIKDKGEQAAYECGVIGLDPRVLNVLGRLHFRTSYGQNVLQHSIEMSHIAGMLAQEIGANVAVAKAGALVHDIGKAIDQSVSGTHVEIGRKILQKFGVNEEIIKAMQAHHEEYPYETLESRIVQTADAISGSRPGARRDNIENYIKRLSELETIAKSFKGINKVYALQAGREIRVFVSPDEVSDLEAKTLARNIALKIEQTIKFPGEIKVVVIRENRVTEFAR